MTDFSSRLFVAGTATEARIVLSPIFQRGRDSEGETLRARVSSILGDIRREGDVALLRYARELDGFRGELKDLCVSPGRMEESFGALPSEIRKALVFAKDRIEEFHGALREKGLSGLASHPGKGGVLVRPLHRVGVYVPGGTAAYPSTVLMTAVVAKVAGVKQIVGVSPAGPEGIPDAILAAFHVCGVQDVYQVGGVHAIAAMAYGTGTIPRVDKIVGPGNRYVAEAKRQVFGDVDIDMVAGPTEVLILADDSAQPEWLAADMIAQAEHDTQASAVLILTDMTLAKAVVLALERQISSLPRQKIAEESLLKFGFILVVPSVQVAVEISDLVAPEHLELQVRNPEKWLGLIQNAGAVFLGSEMAEAFGDYCFGPSHVLPTNGSARFSSPVSIETFTKRTSLLEGFRSRQELEDVVRNSALLARLEGLEGHARSALARLENVGT
jgi:histidinol dehydrogenase